MAKPITVVAKNDTKSESIEQLTEHAKKNSDGLKQAIDLVQELHESGILEAVVSFVQAKEKVAKIAVGQLNRPPVTTIINNAMAAAGALTEVDPALTKKLIGGLSNGLQKAEEGLKKGEKAGVMDLLKALKDPDINRTVLFGLNLLKGMGEGLKE